MDSDKSFKKVKDILKDEINSLEEYLTYQKEKNKKLQDSLKNISKYVGEDKRITDIARNYTKEHDFSSDTKTEEEIDEDINEIYSKMEILHSQLCNITKEFVKNYFPKADEGSANETENRSLMSDECSSSKISYSCPTNTESVFTSSTEKSTPKKSLLEILKELMYDLNPNSVKEGYGVMNVDDTVRFSDIEFLLSAGIVKRSSTNPACIGLPNQLKF